MARTPYPGGTLVRFLIHFSSLLLIWRSSKSTLSPFQISVLITLSLRESPTTHWRKIHFCCLYPQSHSLGLYETTAKGRDIDRLVNQHLSFYSQLCLHRNGLVQRPHHCLNVFMAPVTQAWRPVGNHYEGKIWLQAAARGCWQSLQNGFLKSQSCRLVSDPLATREKCLQLVGEWLLEVFVSCN